MSKGVVFPLTFEEFNVEPNSYERANKCVLIQSQKKFLNEMTRYANAFLFLTQKNIDFYDIAPSVLAAAAIYLARMKMGLRDWWSPQLEIITWFEELEIVPVIQRILLEIKKLHPEFEAKFTFDIGKQ